MNYSGFLQGSFLENSLEFFAICILFARDVLLAVLGIPGTQPDWTLNWEEFS